MTSAVVVDALARVLSTHETLEQAKASVSLGNRAFPVFGAPVSIDAIELGRSLSLYVTGAAIRVAAFDERTLNMARGQFSELAKAVEWFMTRTGTPTVQEATASLALTGANRLYALAKNNAKNGRIAKPAESLAPVDLTEENALPALDAAHGSYSEAAKALGCPRRQLMEWHAAWKAMKAQRPAVVEAVEKELTARIRFTPAEESPAKPAKKEGTKTKLTEQGVGSTEISDDQVKRVYKKHKSVGKAAKELGTSREALTRTLGRLGIAC